MVRDKKKRENKKGVYTMKNSVIVHPIVKTENSKKNKCIAQGNPEQPEEVKQTTTKTPKRSMMLKRKIKRE